jgi:glycosyltransferase involved in cell wall biosynthesis
MNIAFDARGVNWYKGTGIGTYTEKILKNMIADNADMFFELYWSGSDYENFSFGNTQIMMTSKKHHKFFDQYYIPTNVKIKQSEIYHVPQNGIGLSQFISCKKVVTIHDLIPYMMPETVGKGYLLKFLSQIPQVIGISDAIITVSNCSKRDILKFFPIDENKIFVTPLAADESFKPLDKEKCRASLKSKYNINKPYVLYLGGFSPRKNVEVLITAFSKILNKLPKEYVLVLVGECNVEGNSLLKLISTLNIEDKVILTGKVPESDLPLLYNGCELFAYPSLYEGFGLPPLEAMNCGVPVITSLVSSIPEVTGDSCLLINPYNLSELVEAMEKVLSDNSFSNMLCEKGLLRASNFSWKKTAEATVNVYKNLV